MLYIIVFSVVFSSNYCALILLYSPDVFNETRAMRTSNERYGTYDFVITDFQQRNPIKVVGTLKRSFDDVLYNDINVHINAYSSLSTDNIAL